MKKFIVFFAMLTCNGELFAQQMESKAYPGKGHYERPHYKKGADWSDTKFLDSTYFGNVIFSDHAYFISAHFLNDVSFNRINFPKGANFFRAQFLKGVDFDTGQYSGLMDFSYARFSSTVNLYFAQFRPKSVLNLSSISTTDSTSFNFLQAVLPDTILFANNFTYQNDIFFTNSNFTGTSRYDKVHQSNKRVQIYLLGSNIAKLHIDYLHFKLFLPDSTSYISDGVVRFISIDEKAAIYESLLNNFKANGQTESYKLLDIEYQEFKWNHNIWTKHLIWLPKLWWNFGYDKANIFVWTILFMIFFTCFTYFFIYNLNTNVYKIDKIPTNDTWKKKISFRDFGKRLWSAFMYTSTVFFKLTVKIENLEFKEKRGTFYIILVYVSGVICIAYMANFVLQK